MRPRSRPRPERVRPRLRPDELAWRPHGPRGLNIPGFKYWFPAASTCLSRRKYTEALLNHRNYFRLQPNIKSLQATCGCLVVCFTAADKLALLVSSVQ